MLRHCKDNEAFCTEKLIMPLSYVEKMHTIYYRANNIIIHMEIVKVNFFHTVVCQKYEVDIEEADNNLVRIQKGTRDTIFIPLAMFKTRLTWIHQTWASWTSPAQRWLLPHHQLLALGSGRKATPLPCIKATCLGKLSFNQERWITTKRFHTSVCLGS